MAVTNLRQGDRALETDLNRRSWMEKLRHAQFQPPASCIDNPYLGAFRRQRANGYQRSQDVQGNANVTPPLFSRRTAALLAAEVRQLFHELLSVTLRQGRI